MKKTVLVLLALCMVILMAGCSAPASQASSEEPSAAAPSAASASAAASVSAAPSDCSVELTIAAAASLTDATGEIAAAYAKVAPNVKLTFTYGASGTLQTQIEEGAPVDIFMSAAQKQMDALEEKGFLLEGSRKNLLQNKVVLIVPADSNKAIASFEDLVTDKVNLLALGDPESVPAGQYAEEVFTSLDILDAVKEKANYGSDVRQVLTWVESGEVDCGFVYATDAALSEKVTVVCEAPEGSVKDIIYPVSILKDSAYAAEAQAFIDYLMNGDAAGLFEKYGFKMAE